MSQLLISSVFYYCEIGEGAEKLEVLSIMPGRLEELQKGTDKGALSNVVLYGCTWTDGG